MMFGFCIEYGFAWRGLRCLNPPPNLVRTRSLCPTCNQPMSARFCQNSYCAERGKVSPPKDIGEA